MIILDCEQGSDEWRQARSGIATASEFKQIITPTGKLSASRYEYMGDLVAERICGQDEEEFNGEWMQRGTELEDEARSWYELQFNTDVEQVGLIYLDKDKQVSASPDGLITDRTSGLEIKVLKPGNHATTFIVDDLPKKHIQQVQGSMWVTGYQSWDFLSYSRDMKPFVLTVERDEEYIRKLEQYVLAFVKELNEKYELIRFDTAT